MTNPLAGIITTEFKALFNNAIDAMLENTALTVPVQLIYESTKFISCQQCQGDVIGNKPNTGGLVGSLVPIGNISLCPTCHGSNRVKEEVSPETVYLAVVRNSKSFIDFNNVKAPDGAIQTICAISLLPKLKRAKEIIVSSDILPYTKQKYTRIESESPEGLGQSNYCFIVWQRTE